MTLKRVYGFVNYELFEVAVVALNLVAVIGALVWHTWNGWDWFDAGVMLGFSCFIARDWRRWSRGHPAR